MYEAFYIGIDCCQSRLPKSRQHRSFPLLLLDIQVESTFPEPHITSQSKHQRREEIPRCALINIGKTKDQDLNQTSLIQPMHSISVFTCQHY